MNRETIEAIAECRGQKAVEVWINGVARWLTPDAFPCTTEALAQCLSTDAFLSWECGELLAFKRDGSLLLPSKIVSSEPIRFFTRPKKAKTMCGICGLPLHIWRYGWKHSSGGGIRRKCCDGPKPVKLT